MLVLITYDVNTESLEGRKRLSRISKRCKDFGQRVQNSVFECDLDYSQYLNLKHELVKLMDKEKDSLRFYNLGNHYRTRIEQYGAKPSYDPEGTMII